MDMQRFEFALREVVDASLAGGVELTDAERRQVRLGLADLELAARRVRLRLARERVAGCFPLSALEAGRDDMRTRQLPEQDRR